MGTALIGTLNSKLSFNQTISGLVELAVTDYDVEYLTMNQVAFDVLILLEKKVYCEIKPCNNLWCNVTGLTDKFLICTMNLNINANQL